MLEIERSRTKRFGSTLTVLQFITYLVGNQLRVDAIAIKRGGWRGTWGI